MHSLRFLRLHLGSEGGGGGSGVLDSVDLRSYALTCGCEFDLVVCIGLRWLAVVCIVLHWLLVCIALTFTFTCRRVFDLWSCVLDYVGLQLCVLDCIGY